MSRKKPVLSGERRLGSGWMYASIYVVGDDVCKEDDVTMPISGFPNPGDQYFYKSNIWYVYDTNESSVFLTKSYEINQVYDDLIKNYLNNSVTN